MTQSLSMKAGDTFSLDGVYKIDDELVDLTDYTIRCQVRRLPARSLVETLLIELGDQTLDPGVFVMSATDEQTAEWPVGSLICDVRIEDGEGVVKFTETFSIIVAAAVTE